MNIQNITVRTRFLNRRVKPALLYSGLVLAVLTTAVAQQKPVPVRHDFNKELTDANLSFTLPPGFKEIKATANNEDLSFDYAIELPGADFEIWFQVRSLKTKPDKNKVNTDSLYLDMGRAQATALMGDKDYLIRNIPEYSLARYNANEGKTYLLNLPDAATAKHYKYAMVVVLQKNHDGALLAVCLANELGPGFFKNLKTASNCIKFNP